jgi:hypothetical protein
VFHLGLLARITYQIRLSILGALESSSWLFRQWNDERSSAGRLNPLTAQRGQAGLA